MTCNEAFFTLLLAGRLVAAAFVTIPHPNERSADDGLDGELETVVAKVRLAVEDSTLSFTHDPLPSYTYDPQQSHTYGPQPTYTRDSPAKRAEADDVPVGLEEMR